MHALAKVALEEDEDAEAALQMLADPAVMADVLRESGASSAGVLVRTVAGAGNNRLWRAATGLLGSITAKGRGVWQERTSGCRLRNVPRSWRPCSSSQVRLSTASLARTASCLRCKPMPGKPGAAQLHTCTLPMVRILQEGAWHTALLLHTGCAGLRAYLLQDFMPSDKPPVQAWANPARQACL